MRVPHVVIAVNKIDLVDHSEDVFRTVAADVRAIATELGIPDAHAIPVSALVGDNVVDRSDNTPWYDGPALLELLENLAPATDPVHEAFRMPVQLVIRPQGAARSAEHVEYRGYAGQLASGSVRVGDEVVVLPSGRRTTVSGIDLGERSLEVAVAPQSVTLRLADDVDVSRGDLIASAAEPVELRSEVPALACWLGDQPLLPGARLLVKHGSKSVLAMVRSIDGRLDLDTLRLVPTDRLALNDIGRVTVRLASPFPVEPYSRSRTGGAFLLVDPDDGRTLAAVMADASAPGRAAAVTLPVGLDLGGRRVVAVGGGPELVPAVRDVVTAGGLVHVVAPWVCEDLAALVRTGEVGWDEGEYAGSSDLEGAWLVLAGSGDAVVDGTVRADAEQARTWCVLVGPGTPAGSASLPRSAAVSTPEGPVTVATHVEGDDLLARDVTRAVAAGLADGTVDLRRRAPRATAGWVALVGGGPGSDDLLTTRGRHLLAMADVVVADRLAPRAVLESLPASVRVVDVGKAPGRHVVAQDAINDLLVSEALAGRGVVRAQGRRPLRPGARRRGAARLRGPRHPRRGRPGCHQRRRRPARRPASPSPTVAWPAASRSSPVTTSCRPCRPGPTTPSSSSWASAGSPAPWRPSSPPVVRRPAPSPSSSAGSSPTSGSPSGRWATSSRPRQWSASRTRPSSSSATSSASPPLGTRSTTRANPPRETGGQPMTTSMPSGAVTPTTPPWASTSTRSGCPATRRPSTVSAPNGAAASGDRWTRPAGTSARSPRSTETRAPALAAAHACGRQLAG